VFLRGERVGLGNSAAKSAQIVAAARAQLSPDLVDRQATAMDAWHRDGTGDRLRELSAPTLVAAGTEDVVIPPSNALALVNAISGAWLAQFNGGGTPS
jgi:pimeloyl-ACP methyl ester carboxylesterase